MEIIVVLKNAVKRRESQKVMALNEIKAWIDNKCIIKKQVS